MAERRLKVVQVLPALDGGGVERGTLEVAQALVTAGHQSIVISAGGRMVAELENGGSRHVRWDLGKKSPLTLRHLFPLRQWLLRERPDIVHLRSRMPAWVVWLAWRTLPVNQRPRLVTTVHGLYSVSGYSGVMCRGERVIAVSKTIENYIFSNYPWVERDRVRLIYRGVDPEEFPRDYQPDAQWLSAWYRQYPELKGRRVLILPGRLTRLKGHHAFIDLIQRLNQDGQAVYGLIVGGEDPKRKAYARELREKVETLGLDERILFTGNRADMKEIYAVSDLVLSLSTKQEAFGRTVLEALTMGRPVVGYDHGGVGEILGALFPAGRVTPEDAGMLATVAKALLDQPLVPAHNTRFLRQQMLSETLDLYQLLSLSERETS